MTIEQNNDYVSALAISDLIELSFDYPIDDDLKKMNVKALRHFNRTSGASIETADVDIPMGIITIVVDETPLRVGWPKGTRVRVINKDVVKTGTGFWKNTTTTFRTKKDGSWDQAKFMEFMKKAIVISKAAHAEQDAEQLQRRTARNEYRDLDEKFLDGEGHKSDMLHCSPAGVVEAHSTITNRRGVVRMKIEMSVTEDQYLDIMNRLRSGKISG